MTGVAPKGRLFGKNVLEGEFRAAPEEDLFLGELLVGVDDATGRRYLFRIVDVTYADDEVETYQLPLVVRSEPSAALEHALVGTLDGDILRNLIATSRRLLLANVNTALAPMTTYTAFRRTTRRDNPRERLWVYGRGGLPCRKCGTAIEAKKHGPAARLTYWCPVCQRA